MVELVGDQFPAGVLLADPVADRDTHVLVVGGTGGGAGHGVHRGPGEAFGAGRHYQHGDATVLLGVGVGAHRQPHVIGVLDQAGPHLLTVDHVVVTIADRRCPQVRQVGAGLGFGVADGEVQVAVGDLGQVELLLLLGAERHDRRGDAVDRQEWHRRPGDGRFVGEDQLVHRRTGLPAVLLGPAQGQPSVAAHLRHGLPVGVAGAVFAADGHQRFGALGGHQC